MKKKHIIMIVVGSVIVLLAIVGVIFAVSISNYNEVKMQANNTANKVNATIICVSINTYNTFCEDDDKLVRLPDSKQDYNKINTISPIDIEEEEYEDALSWITYDVDKDSFYVLDTSDE